MVYGRETNLPVDLVYPTPEVGYQASCGTDYVEFLRRAIRAAHDFARDHMRKAAIRQKRGYDAHTRDAPAYDKGHLVRWYYPPLRQGNKFGLPWTGPWRIVSRPTDVDYKIKLVANPRKTRVVHHDVLKPYEGGDVAEATNAAISATETASSATDVTAPAQDPRDALLENLREMLSPWDDPIAVNEAETPEDSSPEDTVTSEDDTQTTARKHTPAHDNTPARRPQRTRRKPARYRSE